MEDRELLELAAKAAGVTGLDFDYAQRERHGLYFGPRLPVAPGIQAMCHNYWRPLEDDGDAFRLAVKLRIELERSPYNEHCVYAGPPSTAKWRERSDGERDIYAATRRAIVVAAAEIGRAIP